MDAQAVTRRLWVGAALHESDVAALNAAGITHIVVCNDGENDPVILGKHFSVLLNPTADDGTTKPPVWFDRSIGYTLGALLLRRSAVLIHCAAGINRGPSTMYAVLLALGLAPADAEAAIRKVRPQVGLRYKADAEAAVLSRYGPRL